MSRGNDMVSRRGQTRVGDAGRGALGVGIRVVPAERTVGVFGRGIMSGQVDSAEENRRQKACRRRKADSLPCAVATYKGFFVEPKHLHFPSNTQTILALIGFRVKLHDLPGTGYPPQHLQMKPFTRMADSRRAWNCRSK